MSTYQGIRGLKIRDYTTNPDDPLEGQLWYNKTDQVGKYQVPNQTAAWRTGNNLNTGRFVVGSGGTATDGMIFGGRTGTPVLADSEEWSGSSNTIKVLTD